MAIAHSVLTPVVLVPARTKGTYGVGEVITLGRTLHPGTATLADFGGALTWRVTKGRGVVTGNDNAGNATYTAPDIASEVTVSLLRNDTQARVASASFKVIAPSGVSFIRHVGPVLHTNGTASAGFRADNRLLPRGVSYQNIEIREGAFKGKGTGSYANEDGREHEVGAWGVGTVANGNQIAGFDTVRSDDTLAPFVPGTFEWYIPWSYRVLPAGTEHIFTYITHKEDINALGHVTITKGGVTVSANVGDPTA